MINMETGMTNTINAPDIKQNKAGVFTGFSSPKYHALICDTLELDPMFAEGQDREYYFELTPTENGWNILNKKD